MLEAGRLQLSDSLRRAEGGLRRARATGSAEATVLALDGVKTALAYLGEPERLHEVVTELEPALHGVREHVAAPVDRLRVGAGAGRHG